MSDWVWINPTVVIAFHEEQLAEHGGPSGLRNADALASALMRPRHKAEYGDPEAAELAAAYAFGLARNHPFVDGNKRTALVAAELFLELNGWTLTASDAACVALTLGLAAGQIDEEELTDWIRRNSKPSA